MIQLVQANAVRIPLPDGAVSLCCTSPPYYSLRDYGVIGQIGLEKTPEEYIAKLVEVFAEVRRVLAPDGLCFVNLGDSYASTPTHSDPGKYHRNSKLAEGKRRPSKISPGIPAKNLVLIPQRAALAFQRDGWWVRSFMPWPKNNALPESVRDRPTTAHEYWIMLAKSKRYFWDQEAVRMPSSRPDLVGRVTRRIGVVEQSGTFRNDVGMTGVQYCNPSGRNRRTSDTWLDGLDVMIDEQRRYLAHLEAIRDGTGMLQGQDGEAMALRFNTASFKGAHFATFPAKMIVPLVRAGSSERGVCPVCRRAWRRVVERKKFDRSQDRVYGEGVIPGAHNLGGTVPGSNTRGMPDAQPITTGWTPTCSHLDADGNPHEPVPALVLDPFVGSGTTLEVARRLNRDAIGLDLSRPYLAEQARERLGLAALDAWEMDQPRAATDGLAGLPMFDMEVRE